MEAEKVKLPLYNFQKRFVRAVMLGEKLQTIRAHRKYPASVGDTCHLYTGLRTKRALLLGRRTCVKVEEIEIVSGCSADDSCNCAPRVLLNGVELTLDEKDGLARRDGFSDFSDMAAFWKGRIPFAGHIIHWK